MVNVAGRSKGCATCRRRKVKCDLGHPQCKRCIDMRLVCPGPRIGAFFVHAKADVSSPSQVPYQPPANAVHDALMRMPPPPASAIDACRADAFDQLFVSHFIDSFGLPRNTATGPMWLERLPAFLSASGGNVLSTASIRSASMLSYGTWAHDEAVRADSFRWYARALAQLSLSIAEGQLSDAATEMRVCAAVMLIHFETWAGTSRNAWLHHIKGAASLLEAAGPEACRKGFMQSMFSHMRFQVFIATMHENKIHAFAEEKWLDIPFRDHEKTFFDELVDTLFLVQQCLFVTQKNIALLQTKNKEAVATVKDMVLKAARLLSEWHDTYTPYLQSSFFVERSKQIDAAPLHNNALSRYSNLELLAARVPHASLISLFHAARLITAQISSVTTAGLPDTAGEDTSVILCANDFVSEFNSSGPGSKLRPFMMLPGLKIVSLWSPLDEARTAALMQLMDHKFLNSPMADIALTSEGYFSVAAAGILKLHREFS